MTKEVGMRNLRLLIAAGVIAIAVLAVAPPSQGHDVTVRAYHPRDPSWGEVREHRWITVCDWEVDGHAVYVRYYEDMPQFANIAFRAGYAPSQGCDTWLSAYGYSINRWVVCVQYEGCSAMYGPHGKCRHPSSIGCN